jgi:hypothetical protein
MPHSQEIPIHGDKKTEETYNHLAKDPRYADTIKASREPGLTTTG